MHQAGIEPASQAVSLAVFRCFHSTRQERAVVFPPALLASD